MFFNNKSQGFIVAGLGNPEPKYENTRHNAGFIAVDEIAKDLNASFNKQKFKAKCAETTIDGVKLHLIKPLTYMNLSGQAIGEAASFYKIPPENIIVIFDDISLEPGKLRIRRKGTHGGHNGIKSIIECIGSDNFPRIKLGVGAKPHPDYDLAAWVLSGFRPEEKAELLKAAQSCTDIIRLIISGKTDNAMNKYNS